MKNKKKDLLLEVIIFVLPLMTLYFIFFILPLIQGLYYSLLDWNGISKNKVFVGLGNYIKLFTNDPDYFVSLGFTLKYVILNVIGTNIVAFLLALIVNSKLKCTKFLRTCFFIPNVISMLIVGYIWRFIFNQGFAAIYKATGWGFFNISWLGGGNESIVATVIVAMWQGVGYIMILYLSGLQMVDTSLLEAAAIDGAGKIQQFFKVILPLMVPTIGVNLFMVISQSFRQFDLNLSLTGGGPGRQTTSLALDIYTEGYQNDRLGYAESKAVVLFLIVILIAILQLKLTKSKEVEA